MNTLAQDPEIQSVLAEIKMLKLAINGIEDPADIDMVREAMIGIHDALELFSSVANALKELISVCQMKEKQLTEKMQ